MWVTFDCYGTLVDWRHGMSSALGLVAPGRAQAWLEAYHRHEPAVEREHPDWRYRRILAESARRAAEEAGIPVVADDTEVLGATLPFWPVFPDVAPALGALRAAGGSLALLTNCDRDLVAQTLRRIGAPIDAVVTAEDAGAYKPAAAHFETFRARFRPAAGDWVHVAQSYFHDMVPAARLGLPRIWVNRLGERDDPGLCTAVLPDLVDLPATVARMRRPM